MQGKNAAVAVCDTYNQTEAAIMELERSGLEMRKLSVVGRDNHAEGYVTGYYNAGGPMKYWGKLGTFWGEVWERLAGWAFFTVPGIGPVLVAGPLAGWIVAALENAAIFGGMSPVGAGLYSIGIPRDNVVRYETALMAGKFLVVVHGVADEVAQAREILKSNGFSEAGSQRDGKGNRDITARDDTA